MARIALSFLLAVLAVLGSSRPVAAAEEFRKNNPDRGKYEFVRSYISALSYIQNIDARWRKTPPSKTGEDLKVMRGYVEYLIKDNLQLRIAKNLLTPYMASSNPLVRKTADMFIAACLTDIAVNEKEKEIWNQWYGVKSSKLGTPANERAFIKAQAELADMRKENNKGIVEATILLTKVLKSSARNTDDKGHVLAISSQERTKLLKHLDKFGKDVMDWGLKPGQDHVQASIAVLREILEDTIYTTLNE